MTTKTQKNSRRSSKKAQPKPSYAAEYKKVADAFLYGFQVISHWHMLMFYVHLYDNDGVDTHLRQIAQKYRAQTIKVPNPDDILEATYLYSGVLNHYAGYFVSGHVRGRKLTLKDLQQMHTEIKNREQIYRSILGYCNDPAETLDDFFAETIAQTKTKNRENELRQKLSTFSFESSHTASINTDALIFADSFKKPMSALAKNKESSRKLTKEKR